nr:HAD hydrolase family protein [Propionibacterium sp.]
MPGGAHRDPAVPGGATDAAAPAGADVGERQRLPVLGVAVVGVALVGVPVVGVALAHHRVAVAVRLGRRVADDEPTAVIRLVATDLDGTLLGSDGTIPPGNVAAITEAHAAGVDIVIATGRPVRWLHCLEPIARLRPYVIASNGAVLYDLGEERVLRHHAFGPDAVADLTAAIRAELPGVLFGLERGDLFGLEHGSPSDHAHFPGVLHLDLPELIATVQPVVKVLVYSREASCDALAAAVAPLVEGRATVTTSLVHDEFGMVELSLPGVTKAATLADLADSLGVPAADAVAFGDMPNDLAMLAWAGRGFVMADGHPALLERFPSAGQAGDAGVGRTIRALLRG